MKWKNQQNLKKKNIFKILLYCNELRYSVGFGVSLGFLPLHPPYTET